LEFKINEKRSMHENETGWVLNLNNESFFSTKI